MTNPYNQVAPPPPPGTPWNPRQGGNTVEQFAAKQLNDFIKYIQTLEARITALEVLSSSKT